MGGEEEEVLVAGLVVVGAAAPPFINAVLRVRVEEVSRADAPATVLAEATVPGVTHPGVGGGETRVAVELRARPGSEPIDPRRDYAARASLDLGGGRALSTTVRHPVLTRGFGRTVVLRLGPED